MMHQKVSIRTAGPRDHAAIVAIVNEAYQVEKAFVWGDRTSLSEVNDLTGRGRFLVAEAPPERPVGAVFIEANGDEGYLGMLAVSPDSQGAGLGRELLHAGEDALSTNGCSSVRILVVHVRTELITWYESLGYRERRRLRYPWPENLKHPVEVVEMAKSLSFEVSGSAT